MYISLAGTKKSESLHLVAVNDKESEFAPCKFSAFHGRVVWVVAKEKEFEGRKYHTFGVKFERNGDSHHFELKSGGLALSAVNSLLSASKEQLECVRFSIYTSKEGKKGVSVTYKNGMEDKPNGDQVPKWERLEWFIQGEDRKQYIREYQGKSGTEYDDTKLIEKLIELIGTKEFPARTVTYDGGDIFDEDFSNAPKRTEQSKQADEVFETKTADEDIPFL